MEWSTRPSATRPGRRPAPPTSTRPPRGWARGARALAESRVFAAKPEGAAVAPSLLAQEEAMRALGREALLTSGLHARAEVYGRLLATCGRCHREAGVLFAAVE